MLYSVFACSAAVQCEGLQLSTSTVPGSTRCAKSAVLTCASYCGSQKFRKAWTLFCINVARNITSYHTHTQCQYPPLRVPMLLMVYYLVPLLTAFRNIIHGSEIHPQSHRGDLGTKRRRRKSCVPRVGESLLVV